MLRRSALAAVTAALLVLVLAAPAGASMIVGRNAKNVRLQVNAKGIALVTFRDAGGQKHVLAWGASNADVKFKLDYSGGWSSFHTPLWKRFTDASRPYDGPPLRWVVVARRAPDGSYWALQAWQRMLPNYGYAPWKPLQSAWELHLSHWTGETPRLEIWLDWVYHGRFHHLFGRYTYQGKPVYGFGNTPSGNPLDPYGRNIYVDTFGSAYGPSWKREMSFLTHRPNGNFCYGFYPRRSTYDGSQRPAGNGQRYRATVIGPGVAPDAYWEGQGLGSYDPAFDAEMNRLGDQVAAGDPRCLKD
jgi:hypothetical protein